jgi:hypothetical protein
VGVRIFAGTAIIIPAVYAFTMFWGFNGRLGLAHYPADWAQAKEILDSVPVDTNVLVLPWDTYTDYAWVSNEDPSVRTLARAYFPQPLIFPKHVLNRGGIAGQSSSPEQLFMNDLVFRAPSRTDFGSQVAKMGAGFVLLSKSGAYQNFNYLFRQDDLELLLDGETIALFRNRVAVQRLHLKADAAGNVGPPVNVISASPVKYIIEGPFAQAYVFFPPNADASGWQLDGRAAMPGGPGYSGVFEMTGEDGEFIYEPFKRNILWLFVSVATLGLLAAAMTADYFRGRHPHPERSQGI